MASVTLTHYWPADADTDLVNDQAVCGVAMEHDGQHSCAPTCPTCAAYLAAEDYTVDVLPALAAQADAEQPARRPLSPLGQAFSLALTIARLQVGQVRR